MSLDAATIDRAAGAVLASAAGDALGAPYEFGPPNPAAPCALEGGGSFGWEPGEWTDDTQMALAVLTVVADGGSDVDAIGTEMVRWYASRPRDVGNQTRAVLAAAHRDGSSLRDAAQAFQQRQPDAAGNGALMRTGPVALAALGDRDAVAGLAADVAALTHPHPDSVDACVLWSLAIERAIMPARADERFRMARCPDRRPRPRRAGATGSVARTDRGSRRPRPGRAARQQRMGRRRIPGGAGGDHLDRRRNASTSL